VKPFGQERPAIPPQNLGVGDISEGLFWLIGGTGLNLIKITKQEITRARQRRRIKKLCLGILY